MGRKPKHIKNLTEAEKSSLQKGYKFGNSPLFRRKCHCILQSHSGKTPTELASIFEASVQSVRTWLKQWEREGLEGLKLKPGRGRKPKLKLEDEHQVKTVKKLIENESKNLGRVTSQIKTELGVDLSKRTLKRFLKNLNTDGNASAES